MSDMYKMENFNSSIPSSAITSLLDAIKNSDTPNSLNNRDSTTSHTYNNNHINKNNIQYGIQAHNRLLTNRTSSGFGDQFFDAISLSENKPRSISNLEQINKKKFDAQRRIISSGVVDMINDENDYYWFQPGISHESTSLKTPYNTHGALSANDEVFFTENEDDLMDSKILTNLQSPPSIVSSPKLTTNNIFTIKRDPKYKTELCRNYQQTNKCNYGRKCQFAHGILELKNVERHPNYKTKPCIAYHLDGICNYGKRCNFIHDEIPVYINRVAIKSKSTN